VTFGADCIPLAPFHSSPDFRQTAERLIKNSNDCD